MTPSGFGADRFWQSVEFSDEPSGCWVWKRPLRLDGYARIEVAGRKIYAHRHAYELLVGPIPEGMTLDHLCRNRSCVNPAHLEAVSNAENILRGTSPSAEHARKTHCKRGHPLSGDNLHIRANGARICIACRREDQRRWRVANPEKVQEYERRRPIAPERSSQ